MSTAEVSPALKSKNLIQEIIRREKRGFSTFVADIVVGLTIPRILPKVNALRTRSMGQTHTLSRSEYLKTVNRLLRETLTDLENQEKNEPRRGPLGFLQSQMQKSFMALYTERAYLGIILAAAEQIPSGSAELTEQSINEHIVQSNWRKRF